MVFESTPKFWIPPDFSKETEIRLPNNIPSNAPLLLNAGGIGYFIVNYDAQNWRALNSAVKDKIIDEFHAKRLQAGVRWLWDDLPVKLSELYYIRSA